MKPIDLNDLKNAIQKIRKRLYNGLFCKNRNRPQINIFNQAMQRGEMVVKLDDIVLFSASGSYTKVYYSDNSTQVPSTYLDLIQEKLINTSFLRVHRSYLINLNKV